jgi:hypothetical protein
MSNISNVGCAGAYCHCAVNVWSSGIVTIVEAFTEFSPYSAGSFQLRKVYPDFVVVPKVP